jgi:hypothetical protein
MGGTKSKVKPGTMATKDTTKTPKPKTARIAKTATPKVPKAPKAPKAPKPKAPAKKKGSAVARARARQPRPIARLARLTDPRAALEALIETKGVVKTVESASMDLRPPGLKRERFTFAKIPHTLDIPDLIELQKDSFNWFITEGLRDAFTSASTALENRSIASTSAANAT